MTPDSLSADLRPRLLAGDALASWMVPDPAIPTNRPRHQESYRFPHAVVAGGWAWALTRNAHFSRRERVDFIPQAPKTFAYAASGQRLLCIDNPWASLSSWVPMRRYAEWRWIATPRRALWSDGGDTAPLAAAVAAGHGLTIGLRDADGVFNLHPVEAVALTGTGFALRCEALRYPAVLRDPLALEARWAAETAGYLENLVSDNDFRSSAEPTFTAAWEVSSDGSCRNGDDHRRWRSLTIYAEPWAGSTIDGLELPHALTAGGRTVRLSRCRADGLPLCTVVDDAWPVRPATVVWDAAAAGDTTALAAALARGAAFRLRFTDDEGLLNEHAVDLINLGDEELSIRTELVPYPERLRDPDLGEGLYPAWYCLLGDGTYTNFFDLTRRTVKRYGSAQVLELL